MVMIIVKIMIIIKIMLMIVGGGQGGQNLPLPVPCSLTSRACMCRLPPGLATRRLRESERKRGTKSRDASESRLVPPAEY